VACAGVSEAGADEESVLKQALLPKLAEDDDDLLELAEDDDDLLDRLGAWEAGRGKQTLLNNAWLPAEDEGKLPSVDNELREGFFERLYSKLTSS
jgi:hypothetical protein